MKTIISVLLLFSIFAPSFTLVVGLAGCRPDQIQAITQFKNEFDSRDCNQTDYFNGVWCDNTTGVVTKLQLPSGCLRGTLKPNSSLFGLQHLRYLNLSNNNFTSASLPSGFGNLNKLQVLYLSSNGFIGQVPSSFSNLSQIYILDLSHNELTGSFPFIQNLTKLSILELSYNHFSGAIPSSLLTLPFLSSLHLRENYLTGSIEVPNSSTSSRLEFMYLGNNHFEGKIIEPISKLINLKELDLSFLNTSYPIDLNLFSSLKSLVRFVLSGNSLLATSISSDSKIPLNLEGLVLLSCDLTEFPTILKNLKKLEHIDLSNNKIKGKVPEWLWNLPRLRRVNLFNNLFTDLEGSGEALVNSSVRILDLAYNHFRGPFPKPPLSINLLSAWNNSFTGNIPLETCNRSSLAILDLSYNNLTGQIPRCLSNFQESLIVVNLRKNNLEGSLPDIFSHGALLRTLDVGYNQLTGKLPRSLLNCSTLRFVSVDHNRIKDTFPFWLKALPDLQALTLRSNKFHGPISPPDRGPLAFPKLRILEIADNNFTGSLPPNYFVNWEASSLEVNEDGRIYMGDYNNPYYIYEDTVDLQYKGLFMEQGKVLTSYATIDFSGNKLEGQIPESIGHLKALIALNLSNNAFTGHIPPSLANVTELESLDLSRNQLSGNIPKGLGSLSFLAYISVAHNQLTGEIPQGTQITGQSKSSFEGNAGLCGLPLEETCFGSNAPPTQQPKEEDEEEEQVLNWKAMLIGYGPGLLFGLVIAHVIAPYKPKWFVKIVGSEHNIYIPPTPPKKSYKKQESLRDSRNRNIFFFTFMYRFHLGPESSIACTSKLESSVRSEYLSEDDINSFILLLHFETLSDL